MGTHEPPNRYVTGSDLMTEKFAYVHAPRGESVGDGVIQANEVFS
jgi:hypothetical protein